MIRAGLFSRYFLEVGIQQTEAFRTLNPGDLADQLRGLWGKLAAMPRPNEAKAIADTMDAK